MVITIRLHVFPRPQKQNEYNKKTESHTIKGKYVFEFLFTNQNIIDIFIVVMFEDVTYLQLY